MDPRFQEQLPESGWEKDPRSLGPHPCPPAEPRGLSLSPGPPGPPRSRPDPAAPGGRSVPGDAELGESPAGSRSRSRGGIWGKSHPAAPGRGNAGPEGSQGVGNCSRRAFPGREFPRSGIASRDLWGFRDPGVWSFPAKLEDGECGIRGDMKRLFQGMGAALSLGRARDTQQNFKKSGNFCVGEPCGCWLCGIRDLGCHWQSDRDILGEFGTGWSFQPVPGEFRNGVEHPRAVWEWLPSPGILGMGPRCLQSKQLVNVQRGQPGSLLESLLWEFIPCSLSGMVPLGIPSLIPAWAGSSGICSPCVGSAAFPSLAL